MRAFFAMLSASAIHVNVSAQLPLPDHTRWSPVIAMNKCRSSLSPTVVLLAGLVGGIACLDAIAADRTPIEHVTKKPKQSTQGLGTRAYVPSRSERPFFERLNTKEIATGDDVTGYTLEAKGRKFVGWFGIVREVKEDATQDRTVLTVEHKYFDGLTDVHIQAISFNGGGDFRAVLRGVGHEIPPLSLVKVYGVPIQPGDAGLPRVDADFVRDWHWGTFTFLANYGNQKGSEPWRRLNRVSLDDIYEPYPDIGYYEARLGKRTADDPLYRRLIRSAGKLEPDSKALMMELIDSLFARNLLPVAGVVETTKKRHDERAAIAVLLAAIKEEEVDTSAPCYALGRLAGPAELPQLIALLSDTSAEIRSRSADTLANMGDGATPAVAALANALRDKESTVQICAARALGAVGVPAHSAVDPLKGCIKDHDSGVRLAAADALWQITFQAEPSISIYVSALKDADESTRCAAARALESMGSEGAAAGQALIAALKEPNDYVRSSAAQAIGSTRPDAMSAIPALMATLKDEDSYVRGNAVEALGRYGLAAKPAIPALIAALKDADDNVRWNAVGALGELGSAATEALPTLINLLRHDSVESVRWLSADAIGSIDIKGAVTVPALTEALKDESAAIRRFSAMALGKMGPHAKSALPSLRNMIKDQDVAVRIAAAEAIWKVGADVEIAMPVLLQVFKNEEGLALKWAADAIAAIGPAAKDAVPALVTLLRYDNEHVRESAAKALGRIGLRAESAVPGLIEALRIRDGFCPCAVDAAEALWNISKDTHAIPTLIELLNTRNGAAPAAEALGHIGPDAREAIPALRTAAKNPDPEVRRAIAESLRKIGG